MQIAYDTLIETVVREVLAELARRGVEVRGIPPGVTAGASAPTGMPGTGSTVEIDMTGFKTPVLTEGQLTRIPRGTGTVIVPCSTVVTPGAWDYLRSKRLKLVRKTPSQ
jgi:hypothetical protein